MTRAPRLALATAGDHPGPGAAAIALLGGLTEHKLRVQHFSCRGRTSGEIDLIRAVTGLPARRLDSWLMPAEVRRFSFVRGMASADLAIVEGTLDGSPNGRPRPGMPGPLAEVASDLDMPRVLVLPVDQPDRFHLPPLPRDFDAILIDGLKSPDDYPILKQTVELLARRPVLGAIEALPQARAGLASDDLDTIIDATMRLSASFLRFADLPALRRLAESRRLPVAGENPFPIVRTDSFRVAYPLDAAFGGDGFDTLEALEAIGAEPVEFSPLRDEALPENVDLVLIGCGVPERHAEALAANLSLIADLRSYVCRGGRLFAEGSGAAYLGRSIVIRGRRFPMGSIFPFDAELRSNPSPPLPVSRLLSRPGWLGSRGTVIRGYRSGRWRLHPAPESDDCPIRAGWLTPTREIAFRSNAVGSLIHVHLASLPEVVAAFARPKRASVGPTL